MARRLAPSGDRFLPELSRIAELAVDTAVVARERLTTGADTSYDAAFSGEHAREADRLAAEVTTGAPRALVPPIDGEDAAALAARLRDVVAATQAAARLAGIVGSGPLMVTRLADLLVEATDSLEGGVTSLTARSRAVEFARDVRRVVREGERAYVDILASLLAAAPETLDVVRHREMSRGLCGALRACTVAAAHVERVALKRF